MRTSLRNSQNQLPPQTSASPVLDLSLAYFSAERAPDTPIEKGDKTEKAQPKSAIVPPPGSGEDKERELVIESRLERAITVTIGASYLMGIVNMFRESGGAASFLTPFFFFCALGCCTNLHNSRQRQAVLKGEAEPKRIPSKIWPHMPKIERACRILSDASSAVIFLFMVTKMPLERPVDSLPVLVMTAVLLLDTIDVRRQFKALRPPL